MLSFNVQRVTEHPGPPPKGGGFRMKVWYERYRMSDAWREKRWRVFERANYLCEGCREAKPTEVHHLSYAHIGDEFLFELIALCRECHAKLHRKEP